MPLMEIAAHAPTTVDDLGHSRGLAKSVADGKQGAAVLDVVARALATPEADWPQVPERSDLPRGLGPVVDLLKSYFRIADHDDR